MTKQTRNRISFLTACFGALSAVFLESAYTPGQGLGKAALVMGIFALAAMRLYLFYEGTALAEIDREKAKIAFKLSILLSIALAIYGLIIWKVNPEFKDYALALFLMLQMGLSFTEWVFSARTGEQVNTVLASLQKRHKRGVALALHFRELYQKLANDLQTISKRIDLLSKENAKQAERILALEIQGQNFAKLVTGAVNIQRSGGKPFCCCPNCMQTGIMNILVGGPNSSKLVCLDCGGVVAIPKQRQS